VCERERERGGGGGEREREKERERKRESAGPTLLSERIDSRHVSTARSPTSVSGSPSTGNGAVTFLTMPA